MEWAEAHSENPLFGIAMLAVWSLVIGFAVLVVVTFVRALFAG
jgi:hypothetical protein